MNWLIIGFHVKQSDIQKWIQKSSLVQHRYKQFHGILTTNHILIHRPALFLNIGFGPHYNLWKPITFRHETILGDHKYFKITMKSTRLYAVNFMKLYQPAEVNWGAIYWKHMQFHRIHMLLSSINCFCKLIGIFEYIAFWQLVYVYQQVSCIKSSQEHKWLSTTGFVMEHHLCITNSNQMNESWRSQMSWSNAISFMLEYVHNLIGGWIKCTHKFIEFSGRIVRLSSHLILFAPKSNVNVYTFKPLFRTLFTLAMKYLTKSRLAIHLNRSKMMDFVF